VALELAALEASTPLSPNANAAFVLVVASDADVGAYVSDALRRGIGLDVVAMGSVALALDAAARRRPLVLVVAHTERAVLLSDEAPTSDATHARFAPLVVLRGAFRAERLLDVVASLLAGGAGSSPTNGQTETHDG
jgi:hypothetical protein